MISGATLQEDAEGLGLEFADEDGELISTMNADIGKDATDTVGRCQATIKAQMPPLLLPEMAA